MWTGAQGKRRSENRSGRPQSLSSPPTSLPPPALSSLQPVTGWLSDLRIQSQPP